MKLKLEKPGADRVLEIEMPDGKLNRLVVRRLSVREGDQRDAEIRKINKRIADGTVNGTAGVLQIISLFVKPNTDLKWIWDLEDQEYLRAIVDSLMATVSGQSEATEEEKK